MKQTLHMHRCVLILPCALCVLTAAWCADTMPIDECERIYKRNYINRIKQITLESALEKEKLGGNEDMQRIAVVGSKTYSGLSHDLMRLQSRIAQRLEEQPIEGVASTEMFIVHVSFLSSGNGTRARLDSIAPPQGALQNVVLEALKTTGFTARTASAEAISLQIPVVIPGARGREEWHESAGP